MSVDEIFEKLSLLIQTGARPSWIEKKAGLPTNNLSSVLSGKKKMPEKWKNKLVPFLDGLEKPSTFNYLISEQEAQLIMMKSLGIPVDSGSTFEQLVNAVIFLAGDYKGKWQEEVKKGKEAGTAGMIPPHPKKEDFKDSFEYGAAKSEWKIKYNL